MATAPAAADQDWAEGQYYRMTWTAVLRITFVTETAPLA